MPTFPPGADAAQYAQLAEWCRAALGQPCASAHFTLLNGVKVQIDIPLSMLAAAHQGSHGELAHAQRPPPTGLLTAGDDDAEPWPCPIGWSFRPGEVSKDGIVFTLNGKPARLLAMLAKRGAPVEIQTVIDEVWDGYNPQQSTVRGLILQLNNWLRNTFGLEDGAQPVSHKGGVCCLTDF